MKTPICNKDSEILYHYTDANGLLGILSNKKIWATDYRFLNDSREVYDGHEKIGKYLEKIYGTETNIVKYFHSSLIDRTDVYIFSLTTLRDNLRQWMSYCPANSGYCIGFRKENILNSMQKKAIEHKFHAELSPVIYAEDFEDFVKNNNLGDLFLNPTKSENIYDIEIQNGIKLDSKEKKVYKIETNYQRDVKILELFVKYSFFKKRREFSNEEEIRVIFNPEKDDFKNQNFRTKSGIIIPYITMDLHEESIAEIIVGPNINQEIAKLGITELLDKKNINCKINLSDCSLRVF